MVLNDNLANSLSKVNNATAGLINKVQLKRTKLTLKVLEVMKNNSYVGEVKVVEDGRQGLVEVELVGTINKCGVVKPRFPVKVEEIETYERRFLPAKDFGVLILSTNKGLLTQKEAKEQNVGGTLVAYCY